MLTCAPYVVNATYSNDIIPLAVWDESHKLEAAREMKDNKSLWLEALP